MGFDAATTTGEVLAGVDLGGRLALITGASGGLGFETARSLAAAGASVVLTARNAEKGQAAVERLGTLVPGAAATAGVLELGSLESVRRFGGWFAERWDRLDLLINNAGIMATPLERTEDGFEAQFGCNHLGHFLLTGLLLPRLVAAGPARVVTVSSAGHTASDIVWDDPNYERRPYDRWQAYGQSKTANILFSVELDRRFAAAGVRAFAVHPGRIATDLARHLTRDDFAELSARAKGGLPPRKSVEAGAATTVWAATAGALAGRGGLYLEDCGVSGNHAPWALEQVSAARLWELSETLVGQRFPAS